MVEIVSFDFEHSNRLIIGAANESVVFPIDRGDSERMSAEGLQMLHVISFFSTLFDFKHFACLIL